MAGDDEPDWGEHRRPGSAGRGWVLLERFLRWWTRPRLALGIAAIAAGVAVVVPFNIAGDRHLVADLKDHGVVAAAVVVDVDPAPRGGRLATRVQFTANGSPRTESLQINDSVPPYPVGSAVQVVYDPADPSRVLASSQLDESFEWLGWIVFACFFGVMLGALFAWWRLRRQRGSGNPG